MDGEAGLMGTAGEDGVDGTMGVPGVDGVNGADGVVGEPGMDATRRPVRLLDADLEWFGTNRERLNDVIVTHGVAADDYDASNRPVAVFDWDNTVIKNDIGDATFAWMIINDMVKAPASWRETNLHMLGDAVAALEDHCPLAGLAPGATLRTSDTRCGDALWDVYALNRVPGTTAAAWTDPVTTKINEQYAWFAQMLAGYRPSEVRLMAQLAFDEHSNAARGATVSFGLRTTGVTGWLRVYDEIRDLSETLEANGFDVWAVTASPQFVVEGISTEIGVPANRVIGIRTVVDRGVLGHRLQRCVETETEMPDSLMTFDRGKRCWINRVIFGAADPMARATDPALMPVLVAGDSDTDIAMLLDASDLSVVIHRAKPQTMCYAYAAITAGRDDWIIQPMFISPRRCTMPPAMFDCTMTLDHDGAALVPEEGVFGTYVDTVCVPPAP